MPDFVSSGRFGRRDFLKAAAGAGLFAGVLPRRARAAQPEDLPPVRTITRGPKFHWFGYYDKLQFDPSCRYVLGMEVDFEHRAPKPGDTITVGMVDLEDGNKWIELGESRAWCWQQGCMLQWRPGSKTEILWNDREQDRLVCHILDVATRERRTIPHPIYTISPDGRTALSLDFRRVDDMRPGYGYAGPPEPYRDQRAPQDSGIFRLDLETGRQELIVSLAEIAKIPYPLDDLSVKKHYFNVLLVNPAGSRFLFLHRWLPRGRRDCRTRMLTAAMDGSDVRVLDHCGCTSHLIWRDPQHILAWSWRGSRPGNFWLFEDRPGGKIELVGKDVLTWDGHCSYLPNKDWILLDSYPQGPRRLQSVYLYHVPTGRLKVLGRFHSPPAYQGPWRCDTHPRHSPDGRSVVIDSPHTGGGRQMHLIDSSGITSA
jgi:hypothetical protein